MISLIDGNIDKVKPEALNQEEVKKVMRDCHGFGIQELKKYCEMDQVKQPLWNDVCETTRRRAAKDAQTETEGAGVPYFQPIAVKPSEPPRATSEFTQFTAGRPHPRGGTRQYLGY